MKSFRIFFNEFFFVVPKFGPHGILSSDTISFNNLRHVHLSNDFFSDGTINQNRHRASAESSI